MLLHRTLHTHDVILTDGTRQETVPLATYWDPSDEQAALRAMETAQAMANARQKAAGGAPVRAVAATYREQPPHYREVTPA